MFHEIINQLTDKGWAEVPGLLRASDLKAIGSVANQLSFKEAMVGTKQQRQRVESIRGDHIAWIDSLEINPELSQIKKFLDNLQIELNRKFFLGIKEYECHFAKYPQGSFYRKHLDRFEKDSSRSFTFIFYIHEEWHKEDGGELIIYNKNGEVIQEVVPLPGTFVGFFSEEFPHEVREGKRERKSLTGWMHTKIIY